MKVFRLNEQVRFETPRAWSVQARYAFVYHEGGAFTAAAGRLVIYLGPRRFFDGQENREEHLYRFSDGSVGVLDTPPDGRFTSVQDPEVVALAAQVKSLPEMLAEYGLELDAISRLRPFALIACPMCGGTEFSTVDFAGAWCKQCHTCFETQATAGDPGIVVVATLEDYDYRSASAHFILPRGNLALTAVIKDFGCSSNPPDAPDVPHDGGERSESHVPALRPGRHYGLQVYDWSLYGKAEVPERYQGRRSRIIINDAKAAERIYGKGVRSDRLPSPTLLAEGEADGEGREWWYLVDVLYGGNKIPWWPVWWKVKPNLEPADYGSGKIIAGWVVTDRTLCPNCLRPAGEGDHRYCDWDEMGWEPEVETK
jgi:hypothetical protein